MSATSVNVTFLEGEFPEPLPLHGFHDPVRKEHERHYLRIDPNVCSLGTISTHANLLCRKFDMKKSWRHFPHFIHLVQNDCVFRHCKIEEIDLISALCLLIIFIKRHMEKLGVAQIKIFQKRLERGLDKNQAASPNECSWQCASLSFRDAPKPPERSRWRKMCRYFAPTLQRIVQFNDLPAFYRISN